MKDSHGTIIYVGKAKNLKRRVQSYFQNSKAHPQKIKKLVSNIKDFDYILTDTEFEAFMLECKLIREIKPLFNKMMKSPESYTYIVIQENKGFRSIELSHNRKQDGRLYFGPYQSKRRVESAILGLKESFKILCSNPGTKNTPCLNYSLGLCIGMCLGGSALQEYNKIVDNIIALLENTNLSILEEMKQRMAEAAEEFDFEAAAKYRDKIEAINFLINKEKVIEFTEENKNIVVLEYLSEDTFKLFLIKRNKIVFSENYNAECLTLEQLCTLTKTYFKNTALHSSYEVTRDEIDEAQIIYNYVKSNNCRYITISEKWLHNKTTVNIEKALNKLLYIKIPRLSQ
ncbi:UvrB/UvrC motif-containing protein [Neobacillus niacini]|uniref:UvrB/UvrC motif-containing protein n=1 Tax=Neobacillus niacini TaxID=86668 RepID=UPI002FFFC0EA